MKKKNEKNKNKETIMKECEQQSEASRAANVEVARNEERKIANEGNVGKIGNVASLRELLVKKRNGYIVEEYVNTTKEYKELFARLLSGCFGKQMFVDLCRFLFLSIRKTVLWEILIGREEDANLAVLNYILIKDLERNAQRLWV